MNDRKVEPTLYGARESIANYINKLTLHERNIELLSHSRQKRIETLQEHVNAIRRQLKSDDLPSPISLDRIKEIESKLGPVHSWVIRKFAAFVATLFLIKARFDRSCFLTEHYLETLEIDSKKANGFVFERDPNDIGETMVSTIELEALKKDDPPPFKSELQRRSNMLNYALHKNQVNCGRLQPEFFAELICRKSDKLTSLRRITERCLIRYLFAPLTCGDAVGYADDGNSFYIDDYDEGQAWDEERVEDSQSPHKVPSFIHATHSDHGNWLIPELKNCLRTEYATNVCIPWLHNNVESLVFQLARIVQRTEFVDIIGILKDARIRTPCMLTLQVYAIPTNRHVLQENSEWKPVMGGDMSADAYASNAQTGYIGYPSFVPDSDVAGSGELVRNASSAATLPVIAGTSEEEEKKEQAITALLEKKSTDTPSKLDNLLDPSQTSSDKDAETRASQINAVTAWYMVFRFLTKSQDRNFFLAACKRLNWIPYEQKYNKQNELFRGIAFARDSNVLDGLIVSEAHIAEFADSDELNAFTNVLARAIKNRIETFRAEMQLYSDKSLKTLSVYTGEIYRLLNHMLIQTLWHPFTVLLYDDGHLQVVTKNTVFLLDDEDKLPLVDPHQNDSKLHMFPLPDPDMWNFSLLRGPFNVPIYSFYAVPMRERMDFVKRDLPTHISYEFKEQRVLSDKDNPSIIGTEYAWPIATDSESKKFIETLGLFYVGIEEQDETEEKEVPSARLRHLRICGGLSRFMAEYDEGESEPVIEDLDGNGENEVLTYLNQIYRKEDYTTRPLESPYYTELRKELNNEIKLLQLGTNKQNEIDNAFNVLQNIDLVQHSSYAGAGSVYARAQLLERLEKQEAATWTREDSEDKEVVDFLIEFDCLNRLRDAARQVMETRFHVYETILKVLRGNMKATALEGLRLPTYAVEDEYSEDLFVEAEYTDTEQLSEQATQLLSDTKNNKLYVTEVKTFALLLSKADAKDSGFLNFYRQRLIARLEKFINFNKIYENFIEVFREELPSDGEFTYSQQQFVHSLAYQRRKENVFALPVATANVEQDVNRYTVLGVVFNESLNVLPAGFRLVRDNNVVKF